ncbi:MAG: DNA polymerase III subunit delta' [Alphaproteobacteria bacterium]|nr:DNA polymerase III subunit delta' [Alphaproteobacteria bacterium]
MDEETLEPAGPAYTERLYGHAEAETRVLTAWNAERFPHAWLIGGARGIGKATLAYRIARFVLKYGASTEGGVASEPGLDMFGAPLHAAPASLDVSADDPVFRRIAARGHSDFRLLAKPEDKTTIPVDDLRKVLDFAYQTAAEGGWKAILIDAADDLNASGANALLKCLEEPPAQTVFLLVAHQPGRLLPTIRSRCRALPLRPMAPEAVMAILRTELPDSPEADLALLAALTEGRPGRALAYAEHSAVDFARALAALFETPAGFDFEKVSGLSDILAKKGAEDAYQTFRDLLDAFLQRIIKAGATGRAPRDVAPGDGAIVARAAQALRAGRWIEAREAALSLLDRAGPPANLGKKHVLLSAFITLERAVKAG